jgi:hypothetical protein
MASPTTFTVQKVTPYSIVYLLAGGGLEGTRPISGGPNSIYSDIFAAGFAGGPLAQTLLAAYAGSTAAQFNLDGNGPKAGGFVRTRLVTGVSAAQVLPVNANVHWSGQALSATMDNATELYVEIRLQTSANR